jgi:Maltokinase N-terminal cap domain
MAILYPQAHLQPSKLEVLAPWLPARAWYRGPAAPRVTRVAWFRFDDPEGQVGVETLLVRAGDAAPVYQVPLTYRGAPLDGGDAWLIGTSEHSVLGPRWIYDACGDPVYAGVLATAIITGAGGAEEVEHVDGQPRHREPNMTVRGSGTPDTDGPPFAAITHVEDGDPTLVLTDSVGLAVHRVLDAAAGGHDAGPAVLTATWGGQSSPVLLAEVRNR